MSPIKDFETSIGEKVFSNIVAMISWLYEIEASSIELVEGRLAPSLITRSESEYLGLSSPRFSVRMLVNNQGTTNGFLNLRRLADLENAILTRFDITVLPRNLRNAIADSYLAIPPRLSGYHCLTVPLAMTYGEDGPDRGVPYVSQLEWLGGGVCAECAAMVSVELVFKHCGRVHGVAEVKALTQSGEVDLLHSGGMSPDSLVTYLRREMPGPGLWAFKLVTQRPAHRSLGSDVSVMARDFSWALRCLVASGVPVILPIDLTRLNGQRAGCEDYSNTTKTDILTNNDPPSCAFDDWGQFRMREHMVVVVGIGRSGATSLQPASKDGFVIHCSATLPFLKATGAELYDVVSEDRGRERIFIPVTNKNVQVPLMPSDSPDSILSITEVAAWLQRYSMSPLSVETSHHYDVGFFRLADLDEWSVNNTSELPVNTFVNSDDFPLEVAARIIDRLSEIKQVAGGDGSSRFVWLQHQPALKGLGRCVHVWDAELPEVTVQTLANFGELDEEGYYLLRHYYIGRISEGDAGDWNFEPNADFDAINQVVSEENQTSSDVCVQNGVVPLTSQEKKSVDLGLINSYDPRGEFVASGWPDDEVSCEYYAFMEPEIARWVDDGLLHVPAGNRIPTAVQLLATLADDEMLRSRISKKIIEGMGTSICSIASFFQEHSDEPGSDRAAIGIRALKGLFLLAKSLHDEGGHQVSSVEIVCGNRLGDVQIPVSLQQFAEQDSNIEPWRLTGVVAPVRSSFVAIDYLLHNLSVAIEEVQAEISAMRLRIALELEPGELFVNSSLESLHRLAHRIIKSPVLNQYVYFNLDCSHFAQAGVTPEDLISCPEVMDRLTHVHASGCDVRGHFGDTENLSLFGFEKVIRKMVRNLHQSGRRTTICAEFEAAPTIDKVHQSLSNLKKCLEDL